MCGARYSFTTSFVVIALVVLGAQAVAPPALAQEGASGSVVDKGRREQELREQMQKILHELEELQSRLREPPRRRSNRPWCRRRRGLPRNHRRRRFPSMSWPT